MENVVLDFSGIDGTFSLFSLMLDDGLLYIAFIMFRYIPCILVLSKTFIMKGYCILSKDFETSNEMIMWFLFFSLFMWWIMLTDFHMLHLWDKANFIMVDDGSHVLLDLIYKCFI